ncbi:MAG: hypothetical protein Q9224_003467 [Gallowayella concinna]
MLITSVLFDLCLFAAAAATSLADLPVKLEVKAPLNSRSANIHLSQSHRSVYPFTVTYGDCPTRNDRLASHHTISTVYHQGTDRLVWLLPDDIASGGCLSAWSSNSELVGHSRPLAINKESRQWIKKSRLEKGTKLGKRASIPMTSASGIDAGGPWFDGVEVLKQKEISVVDAAQRLLLRVHTAYLEGGPSDYQYQEMGPMRFPESIQYAGSNETIPVNDMKLTFQLAEVMNQLNKANPNYTVKFIPWIQNSPNGLYYFSGLKGSDGLPPTATENKNNPKFAIAIPADPIIGNITDQISQIGCDPKIMAAAAKNVFKAHKSFLDTGLGGLGGDDWSEFAYFHNHLKYSLNATDQAVNGGAYVGYGGNSLWDTIYNCVYFSATTWRTIDGVWSLSSAPLLSLTSNALVLSMSQCPLLDPTP